MKLADTIQMLRRRINDTSEEPAFSDADLKGYILDALAKLQVRVPDFDITIENDEFNRDITPAEASLVALQAHVLITEAVKSSADRDNFTIRKGRLEIDTSGQSADHARTLEHLTKELDDMIYDMYFRVTGVRVE